MKMNSLKGKTSGVGKLMNILLWKEIDHPTIVPIITPLKLLAITKIKAS
jgi:hypothetical protein